MGSRCLRRPGGLASSMVLPPIELGLRVQEVNSLLIMMMPSSWLISACTMLSLESVGTLSLPGAPRSITSPIVFGTRGKCGNTLASWWRSRPT